VRHTHSVVPDGAFMSQHHTLTRHLAGLELTSQETGPGRDGLNIMGIVLVLVGPLLLVSALSAAVGRPETITAPHARRHGGLLVDAVALHPSAARKPVHRIHATAATMTTQDRARSPVT